MRYIKLYESLYEPISLYNYNVVSNFNNMVLFTVNESKKIIEIVERFLENLIDKNYGDYIKSDSIYTELIIISFSIKMNAQKIFIRKGDDDYYYIKYENEMINRKYHSYFKCDQINGIKQFLVDYIGNKKIIKI